MESSKLNLAEIFIGTTVISLGILSLYEVLSGDKNANEKEAKKKGRALKRSSKTVSVNETNNDRMKILVADILEGEDNLPADSKEFIKRIYEAALKYLPVNKTLLTLTPKTNEELEGMLHRFGLYDKYYRKVLLKIPNIEIISTTVHRKNERRTYIEVPVTTKNSFNRTIVESNC
jgi:hypothetical protein